MCIRDRYDPDQARADEVELAVQICGKIKGRVTVAADAPEPEVLAAAREAVEMCIRDRLTPRASASSPTRAPTL